MGSGQAGRRAAARHPRPGTAAPPPPLPLQETKLAATKVTEDLACVPGYEVGGKRGGGRPEGARARAHSPAHPPPPHPTPPPTPADVPDKPTTEIFRLANC